eukprot:g13601.t1
MFTEALRCAQDAEEYVEDSSIGTEIAGEGFRAIGELYSSIGQALKAAECFRKHCLLIEEFCGPDHIRCSDGYTVLSCLLAKQGKFEEALEYGINALKIREEHFGDKNMHTANSHYNVGLLYRSLGLLDMARTQFSIAVEVRKLIFGIYSLPVAEIEVSFGFTQEQRGFYNDAINRYDRAFRIRKKILGEAHEYTRAVHRMLVRARTRSKAANSSTDHPNEDVLLTSVAIKNAIKTINQSSHVKNIARRCYALNPYLQAELVYSTGLSSATKRVLVKRFKKHQDLLDDLLLEIEQFKAGIPINTKEMIHIIKASLNRVTEEPVVTFKMEREILSACPLRISQLKKIFQGVEKSEAAIMLIVQHILDPIVETIQFQPKERELYTQRMLTAICKINAKNLSKGNTAAISVPMTEKLLLAAYKSKLHAAQIMKITSPEAEIGEAILEQLTVDDRRINHAQSIRQHYDKNFLTPCGIFVAITIMGELHPDLAFDAPVVVSLLQAAKSRLLTLNDIPSLISRNQEFLGMYFIPLLQAVTFWEIERPFIRKREIILSESENSFRYAKGTLRDDTPLPLPQKKNTTESEGKAKGREALLNFSSSPKIQKLSKVLYSIAEDHSLHLPDILIEDVMSGEVDSIRDLKGKIIAGNYGNFHFEPILNIHDGISNTEVKIPHLGLIYEPEKQAVSLATSTVDNVYGAPTVLSARQLGSLKSKYPHLSAAIDEISKELQRNEDTKSAQLDDYKKMHLNFKILKRDNFGRRLKEVPITAKELWKMVYSKFLMFGYMQKVKKDRKLKQIATKLLSTGCLVKARWLRAIRGQTVLWLAVGLFKFLHSKKYSKGRNSLGALMGVMKFSRNAINKTKYKGPKLRGVHWATVDEASTKGTIWEGRKRTFSTVSHIFKDVEDVFAPGLMRKAATQTKEKKKQTTISLLDPKRTQNMSIALARVWPGSFEELGRAVKLLKAELIGIDNVEKLLKIIPTTEEFNRVKKYTGPLSALNKADRFVSAMGSVARLQPRLSAMIFQDKFRDSVSSIRESVELIKCASNEILGSHNFQELLGIVLSLGNKLNQNTRKQLAAGIKIDGLTKLASTKGKTGVTVLEYMVQNLLSSKSEILEVGQELLHLKSASLTNYASIEVDVRMLTRGLDNIKSQMAIDKKTAETVFEDKLGQFYDFATDEMKSVHSVFEEMKTLYRRAAQWLFEDPDKVQPAKLFSKILIFTSAIEQTKAKILQKAKRVSKSARNEVIRLQRNDKSLVLS